MIRDQRSQGRHAILGEIRRAGSVARVDLARRTGLSQATVTAITAELMGAGLIEEGTALAGSGDARRGRPRVGLQIRGAAHLVAGAKIADRSIVAAVADFTGRVLGEATVPLSGRVQGTEALARDIAAAAAKAAEAAGTGLAGLSGLGAALAGIVDAEAGIARWSPALERRNAPLRAALEAATGLPSFIDNDANLVAMAELYFGEGKGIADFLVVTVESGVGLGIVLGGRIYRGIRGSGAEFGHTKVQIDGALCRCGQRGCLEAYVADYALLREAALRPGPHPGDPQAGMAQLLAQARSGDPMAASIVARAERIFAMGLANLVNIFDPQLIILSGELAQHDYLYDEKVIAMVAGQTVQAGAPPPEIRVHRWDDLMWARGAAAYAIEGLAARALAGLGEDAA
ncbi:ROK family transcriptional regulator [Mangrovicoccus algicola]|uniref:ROK family transcriptional regulator n=1 Tax=Mangrovicoccus algicola TaxID=2771008 RepID=A0A8J6YVR9_9RHOB|nr:ROK family transcriptional regulator [Mangrovicoccus algicola]MBE3638657.1 ROK family transcriptional regulator [Mangrovicoccus algicola]